MRELRLRLLVYMALGMLLLAALGSLGPLQAQVQTEPQSPSPSASPFPAERPPASPSPSASPRRVPTPAPSPLRPLTGRLELEKERVSDFLWKRRLINGTDHDISSIHLIVPEKIYDSRVMPVVPGGWLLRRQPGEGPYAGSWVLSWLFGGPSGALTAGHVIDLDLTSATPMLLEERSTRLMFGTGGADRLVYPWDTDFLPLPIVIPSLGRTGVRWMERIPWPRLSSIVVNGPSAEVFREKERGRAQVEVLGQGRHSGEVFRLQMRTPYAMVARIEPGTVLVPSVEGFDDIILDRPERLPMAPRDVAAIMLHGYSITYGRKAPPVRVQDRLLDYRMVREHRFLDAYRVILKRAGRLRPHLFTPATQDLPDLVVQWALWRQERILEGNPLDIRDIERDLALFFRWTTDTTSTVPGRMKREYLNPLQVREVAREIWAQSDQLLYESPPSLPLP